MADEWATQSTGIGGPARNAAVVTPSDAADLPNATRALYVAGAGDISMITVGGQTVSLTAVPAGSILPLCVARVRATGTTATGMVAFW